MPNASRMNDMTTGHGPFAPVPIIKGSTNVMINGQGAARQTDQTLIHCAGPACHATPVKSGSSTVNINGFQAARVGDPITCGGTIITGSATVFIGG